MSTKNFLLGLGAFTSAQLSLAQEMQDPQDMQGEKEAQEVPSHEQEPVKTYHKLYLSLGQVNLDAAVALQEGIKDSATYIRFAWEGQKNQLLYGAGISGYLYSDRREFDQVVEDNFGNVSTAGSDADAFNLFFEGGYRYETSKNISLDILGGYELVMESERAIPNCIDCATSDINIEGGLYFTPRLTFVANNGLLLAASYHQYLSGDVENAISVTIGMRY